MRDRTPLFGIIPYLVTPLVDDGQVDEHAMRKLIEHLIEAGVHGLSPLGSTGEVMYLDATARDAVVRITVDAAAGRVPVVPGIAAHATADAVAQARRCEELGADGIVAIRLAYVPLPTDAVTSFYAGVAEATDLPVVLYSNSRLGAEIPLASLRELARYPTVRYLKDASGDTGRLLSVQNAVGSSLAIFAASAHIPALVFELGGVGWMAGPACVAPYAALLLHRLHTEGRRQELMLLQQALWPLNELFGRYGPAAFVKCALAEQGFAVGDPVPPQSPAPADTARQFRQVMESVARTVEAIETTWSLDLA